MSVLPNASREQARETFNFLMRSLVADVEKHPDAPDGFERWPLRHVPNAGPLVVYAAPGSTPDDPEVVCITPWIMGTISMYVDGHLIGIPYWIGHSIWFRERVLCAGPDPDNVRWRPL